MSDDWYLRTFPPRKPIDPPQPCDVCGSWTITVLAGKVIPIHHDWCPEAKSQ